MIDLIPRTWALRFDHPRQFIRDRLSGGQVRKRSFSVEKKPGSLLWVLDATDAGWHQYRRASGRHRDRQDGRGSPKLLPERAVVEHGAVNDAAVAGSTFA